MTSPRLKIKRPPRTAGPHETFRALARGLRVVQSAKKGMHWQGGKPLHRGAKCALCKQPLRLIWDIDLADPQLPDGLREKLAPRTRLPIYFCCLCPKPTVYSLVSDSSLRMFRPKSVSLDYDPWNDPHEQNPFREAPAQFVRQPIRLEPIPIVVEGLISLAEEIGVQRLDDEARRILSRYVGKTVSSNWDLPFSQFGGLPLVSQGHREVVCPNPTCFASRLVHPYPSFDRRFLMRELAVVTSEPPLDSQSFHYAQIAVHICLHCASIHSEYRCD